MSVFYESWHRAGIEKLSSILDENFSANFLLPMFFK